jgi:hypothetical protein
MDTELIPRQANGVIPLKGDKRNTIMGSFLAWNPSLEGLHLGAGKSRAFGAESFILFTGTE